MPEIDVCAAVMAKLPRKKRNSPFRIASLIAACAVLVLGVALFRPLLPGAQTMALDYDSAVPESAAGPVAEPEKPQIMMAMKTAGGIPAEAPMLYATAFSTAVDVLRIAETAVTYTPLFEKQHLEELQ